MPNFSETGGETFTKFSDSFGSSLGYPVQNMEGMCPPNFGGRGGKVEPLIPISPQWEVWGLSIFVQLGPLSTQKYNLSIRTPVKGAGKNSFCFSETSLQIFRKFSAFFWGGVIPKTPV